MLCKWHAVRMREAIPTCTAGICPQAKYRKLDETPFDPCMVNYTSAELSADQLEAQFREDESAGMMIATTEGAVKQEFGEGQLLIAAMGALVKPSGQIRPLHDGTHGIRLNNSIKVLDRLEHPGPADIVEVVAQAADAGEAPFCICADIAMAHRRAKVRRKDWPKLGCKARSDSKVIWLNCVGTFGVSSAAILWARLFGCVADGSSEFLVRSSTCRSSSWMIYMSSWLARENLERFGQSSAPTSLSVRLSLSISLKVELPLNSWASSFLMRRLALEFQRSGWLGS